MVTVGVLLTSVVMMALLAAGRFVATWAAFASAVAYLAAWLAFVRRVESSFAPRAALGFAIIALAALALRWDPFLHVEGGQDQGVYVAISGHIARHHTLAITDRVRERLPAEHRAEYDKQNLSPVSVVPGRFEGYRQPGVYVANLERSAYAFQFFPLHPLWMALWGELFGEENRVYSLVFLSVLNGAMLSLLAYELAGRRVGAALIAAGLLAVNPVHVFLSRFPVSENVTVFFTAAALYYLARYFGGRQSRPLDLVLSAASWGGAFFAHVSGFMYAPIIGAMLMAALMAARTREERNRIFAYGMVIVAAYGLSMAFALRWSYPYTHDIYRIILGTGIGQFILDHWLILVVVLAAAIPFAGAWAWVRRGAVVAAFARPSVDRVVHLALSAAIAATLAYGLLQAYRVGFTSHFEGDEWLDKRWGLSSGAWRGFLHGAAPALALYVSPFVLAFFVWGLWARRAASDIPEKLLMAFVALFLFVRLVLDGFTPYYFYSRYLGAEVLPFLIVLVAAWMQRAFDAPSPSSRAAAAAVLAGALAWSAVTVALQYPGGEMHRSDQGMRPLAANIRDQDVLLVSGVEYPPMFTALEYYYGRNVVKVDPARLKESVRRYASTWSDVYVLAATPSLSGLAYLGTYPMLRDHYERSGTFSVLPLASTGHEVTLALYRAPRSARLGDGDVISFAGDGTAAAYLGAGWSGQERYMRWTDGPSATLLLPLTEGAAYQLRFELRAHNCVPAEVRVNGEVRTRWTFTDCNGYGERVVSVRPEDVPSGVQDDLTPRPVVIKFEIPQAKSPREVNPASSDPRQLGLSVTKLRLERTAR